MPFRGGLVFTRGEQGAMSKGAAFIRFIRVILPRFVFGRRDRAEVRSVRGLLRVAEFVGQRVTGGVYSSVILPSFVSQEEGRHLRCFVVKVSLPCALGWEASLLGLPREDNIGPGMALIFLCLLTGGVMRRPIPLRRLPKFTAR